MASTIKVDEILDSQGNQFDGSQLGNVGKVLQVVHINLKDPFVSSAVAWTDITGLTATITPSSTSSKILLTSVIQVGGANPWGGSHYRVTRNGTVLSVGTETGHQVNAHIGGLMYNSAHSLYSKNIVEYDSPNTTSPVTYKIQGYPEQDGGGGYIYVNTMAKKSTVYTSNGVSTLVLMEIGA